MSSESERSTRDVPSGGSWSRGTVKVYVPDCVGVKAGMTARISASWFVLMVESDCEKLIVAEYVDAAL